MADWIGRSAARLESMRGRVEASRTRFSVLDAILDEVEREADLGSGILAGALAYRLFLFFLPLSLFLIATLGLLADVLGSTPRAIGKDVGLVGLVTNEVAASADGRSSLWVALASLVVLVYATAVLYRAVAVVHALAWERSASSAKQRRSLRRFAIGIVAQLALILAVGAVRAQTAAGGAAVLVVYAAAAASIWLAVSLGLPHGSAHWTELIPGALLYGVGLVAVNAFNTYLLGSIHATRASTYGTLGAAAAVLLSLFFVGRIIVSAAVLNATLSGRRRVPIPS